MAVERTITWRKAMTTDTILGLDNARAWYASIVEMVTELERADESRYDYDGDGNARECEPEVSRDEAERTIHESALSVEVRSGWYLPGEHDQHSRPSPAEYRILLTTGGPALQLVGELDEHGEPETAELQSQDWGTPWTRIGSLTIAGWQPDYAEQEVDERVARCDKVDQTLLTFARCFYFGE